MNHNDQARWIWYPGDFEIWLGNRFNNRRSERGAFFPPFWKQDSHWPTVEFSKSFSLAGEETVCIEAEGIFNLMLDGKLQFGQPETFTLPAGEHRLNLKVHNQATPPALLIRGEHVFTDESWLATYEDKIWIDENGVSHGSGIYVPAARWDFSEPGKGPSTFRLSRRPAQAVEGRSVEGRPGAVLYDFGRETMGYVKLHGLKGEGLLHIYYGESAEEALDSACCETLDRLSLQDGSVTDLAHRLKAGRPADGCFTLPESKAFRYVCLEGEGGASAADLSMEVEYLPQDLSKSGSFRCSDEELNRIWETGAYTMDLTTREFFLDGIKRDRWTWSGDAIQSYLMNYYLRFDTETVKRTIRQLRGKDPVTAHVNTIMDYSFYWFKSIYDYYLFTGDLCFVREMYPKMVTLMDYCLSRTVEKGTSFNGKSVEGLMEGQSDDWIFVDWVDFPMQKRGIMCFEQILFAASLQTMSSCAGLLGLHDQAERYTRLLEGVRSNTENLFWDEQRKAYLHNIDLKEGTLNGMVTKFPNMFAILFDLTGEKRNGEILRNVMLNPEVEAITTPYMRFYELEALCRLGLQEQVLREMKDYWGGMLREGATSFWEKYIPGEKGREHLQMYGRPYGKSLCHAWGASPVYLTGRYYLGVRPLSPGYEKAEIAPVLGGLEWMEGNVPTPHGPISVRCSRREISVKIPYGKAEVRFSTANVPTVNGGRLEQTADGVYVLCIDASQTFVIGL